MFYIVTGLLGFLLSGIWYATNIFLLNIFANKGWKVAGHFSPLLASLLLLAAISLYRGYLPLNLHMLFNYQLWAIVVATLIITCLVIRLKKTCHHNKYKLLGLCMEAASIEIAQRLMMQTFVMLLLDHWKCLTIWCVLINALIWCLDILVQPVLLRQPVKKGILIELIASFIFSMGIGYVFYSSECFLFGVLAHIAERMISNLSKNRIQEYAVRHKKDQND